MNKPFNYLRHVDWLVLAALVLATGATGAGLVPAAQAAVPTQVAAEGVLLSSGGGPAADGNYTVAFAVYGAETGGVASWSESGVTVAVKGGQFSHLLGSKSPLSAAALNLTTAWLGIQIGTDPELPRKAMGAGPFALRAAIAEGLDCSGCLKAGQLDPAVLQPYAKAADLSGYVKTGDLAGYAKTADLSSYVKATDLSEYVKAASLAKVAGTGSFNDLKDLPVLAKVATSGSYADLTSKPPLAQLGSACGTSLVMKGIKADGSYECVAAGIGPDMINEVSNDLLWNQFTENTSGSADVKIKDGFVAGTTDSLTFPDLGVVQKIWVKVDVANSDVSKLEIELYAPGLANPYILYKGSKSGTAIAAKFNDDTALVSGDLNKDWLGKNAKGGWSISVKDLAAITVPPGTPPFEFDGKFNWSIYVQTLSSKKMQVKGDLLVDGLLQLQVADVHPANCDASRFGQMYANKKDNAMYMCNGKAWFGLPIDAVPVSCKDALKMDSAATDGMYTIDPDGPFSDPPFKVYCDMTTDGGGWMLVMQIASTGSTDGTLGFNSPYWTGTNLLNETPVSQLTNINAKYVPFNTVKAVVGRVMLKDKKTNKFSSLAIPGFVGKTLLERFSSLGKTNLSVTAGAASPQEMMGYAPVSGMCQPNSPWMLNMLSNHSGVRLGNDVASNAQTTNNVSSWACYDNGCNLSYSGAGGTLESGRQWQDGWGSEALNRYRDNGGTGQGSHNGVAIFIQ